jgi:hypothetical protein
VFLILEENNKTIYYLQVFMFLLNCLQRLSAHLSFCFEETYYRAFHRCFLPSFGSFGQAVSEKKIFRNRPIWNKNCLWQPCLLTNRDEMSTLYRGPSIDASYQVSVHLVKWFQRRKFLKQSANQKQEFCVSAKGRHTRHGRLNFRYG